MNTKLLKVANHIREKRAGIGGDAIRGMATTAGTYLPLAMTGPEGARLGLALSGAQGLSGMAHGLFSRVPSFRELEEMDNSPNKSFLPGVAPSRLIRRRRALRKALRDNPELFNIPVSEVSGSLLNIPITSALFGTLGRIGQGRPDDPDYDAVENTSRLGAGVSIGASVLGSLLAAFTKRRSLEEQAAIENSTSRALLRHIVPGLGAYDFWKGLGATRNLSGDIGTLRKNIQELREKRRIANNTEEEPDY